MIAITSIFQCCYPLAFSTTSNPKYPGKPTALSRIDRFRGSVIMLFTSRLLTCKIAFCLELLELALPRTVTGDMASSANAFHFER